MVDLALLLRHDLGQVLLHTAERDGLEAVEQHVVLGLDRPGRRVQVHRLVVHVHGVAQLHGLQRCSVLVLRGLLQRNEGHLPLDGDIAHLVRRSVLRRAVPELRFRRRVLELVGEVDAQDTAAAACHRDVVLRKHHQRAALRVIPIGEDAPVLRLDRRVLLQCGHVLRVADGHAAVGSELRPERGGVIVEVPLPAVHVQQRAGHAAHHLPQGHRRRGLVGRGHRPGGRERERTAGRHAAGRQGRERGRQARLAVRRAHVAAHVVADVPRIYRHDPVQGTRDAVDPEALLRSEVVRVRPDDAVVGQLAEYVAGHRVPHHQLVHAVDLVRHQAGQGVGQPAQAVACQGRRG